MSVRVVTDTNVNLPQELVQNLHITLVPAIVIFNGEAIKEGLEISTSEVINRIEAGDEFPTTSQPPPHDFEEAYRKILERDPTTTILSLHIIGSQSGTVRSAEEAANNLRLEMPQVDIRVFDTKAFSIAQGLMVHEAAVLANMGEAADSILERLVEMRDKIKLFFVLDTLDFVHKGGRLSGAAHLVGSLMRIKAVLTIQEGQLVPYAKFRTMTKALDALRELISQAADGLEKVHVAVGYVIRESDANQLVEQIREQLEPEVLLKHEIGPALAVYTGPGAVGVAWCASRKD